VAEFGLLLRDAGVGPERWDALARRVSSLTVDVSREADRTQLAELVALATHLR
jgi:hypothetical protein